jgi:hypothetical protein
MTIASRGTIVGRLSGANTTCNEADAALVSAAPWLTRPTSVRRKPAANTAIAPARIMRGASSTTTRSAATHPVATISGFQP